MKRVRASFRKVVTFSNVLYMPRRGLPFILITLVDYSGEYIQATGGQIHSANNAKRPRKNH